MFELTNQYESKLESSSDELKEVYQEFIDQLDEIQSKILGVGKYAEQEELNIKGVVDRSFDGLSSYSQVTVLYKYEDGNSLVIDTANEFHLIPFDNIKVEAQKEEVL